MRTKADIYLFYDHSVTEIQPNFALIVLVYKYVLIDQLLITLKGFLCLG